MTNMAYQPFKIHVKFTKNDQDLGHAFGHAEGDYLSFSKEQLRALIGRNFMSLIELSTLTILDSRTQIKVTKIVQYEEDQSVNIYCGADSIIAAQVIPLPIIQPKTIIGRFKDYILELAA
jgi:hypothetical protein